MQHVPEEFVGPNSIPDRRARVRHSPKSLTYVKIGGANGGVILDISESGMSVASAEPLTEVPLPALTFRLPHLDHTFTTSAELVWNSDTRQSAGLRFGSLSTQDRLQIKNWIKTELYAEAFPATDTRMLANRQPMPHPVMPKPRPSSRVSNCAPEKSASTDSPAVASRFPMGLPEGLPGGSAPAFSADKAAEFDRLFPSENAAEMQAVKAARAAKSRARSAPAKIESPDYGTLFPSEHPDAEAAAANPLAEIAAGVEPEVAAAEPSRAASPSPEVSEQVAELEAIPVEAINEQPAVIAEVAAPETVAASLTDSEALDTLPTERIANLTTTEAPAAEIAEPAMESAQAEASFVEDSAVEAPALDAPAIASSAVETAAHEAPAIEVPSVEATPIEAPVIEVPVAEVPAVEPVVAAQQDAAPVAEPMLEASVTSSAEAIEAAPTAEIESRTTDAEISNAPTNLDSRLAPTLIDAGEFAAAPAVAASDASADPAHAATSAPQQFDTLDNVDEIEESDVPVHELNPVAGLAALRVADSAAPAQTEIEETPQPLAAETIAAPAAEPPSIAAPTLESPATALPAFEDLPAPVQTPGRFTGGAVSDASVESLLAIAAAEEKSESDFRALRASAVRRVVAPKPPAKPAERAVAPAARPAAARIATPRPVASASASASAPAMAASAPAAQPRHVALRSPSQQALPADELESGDKNFRGLVVAASFVLIALCFAVGYSSGVRWLQFSWPAASNTSANNVVPAPSATPSTPTGTSAATISTPSVAQPTSAAASDLTISPKHAVPAKSDATSKSASNASAQPATTRLPDSATVAPDPKFSAPPLPAATAASALPESFFPVTAPAEGSTARMVELPDQVVFDSPKVLIRMRQYFFVAPEPGPEWKHKLEHLTIGDPEAKISPAPAKGDQTDVVRVRATIGKDGTVTDVRPLSGSTNLIPQTVSAIRQWRYQPTTLDGRPMEWQGDFTIEFRPAP